MRAILITLAAVFLFIGPATTAVARGQLADPYVVKGGDAIWSIIKKHTSGESFAIRRMAFYVANPRLVTDSRIYPSDVVYLPRNAARYLVQTQHLLRSTTAYTVVRGDSISRIADKQMRGGMLAQRMAVLYAANPVLIERSVAHGHLIRPGEVYRLPVNPLAYLARVSNVTRGRDTMWGSIPAVFATTEQLHRVPDNILAPKAMGLVLRSSIPSPMPSTWTLTVVTVIIVVLVVAYLVAIAFRLRKKNKKTKQNEEPHP